jgi:hypothetical protein
MSKRKNEYNVVYFNPLEAGGAGSRRGCAAVRRAVGAPWAPPPASTRACPSPSTPPPLSTTSSPPSAGLQFHSKNRDDTHGHYCHDIGIGMKPQSMAEKTHRRSGLARLAARRAHEFVTGPLRLLSHLHLHPSTDQLTNRK